MFELLRLPHLVRPLVCTSQTLSLTDVFQSFLNFQDTVTKRHLLEYHHAHLASPWFCLHVFLGEGQLTHVVDLHAQIGILSPVSMDTVNGPNILVAVSPSMQSRFNIQYSGYILISNLTFSIFAQNFERSFYRGATTLYLLRRTLCTIINRQPI
jgi:hypothetical protein